MKAVGAQRFGGPQVLEVLDLPVPETGPGQIRIRVRAAAVNPTDTLLRSGAAIVVVVSVGRHGAYAEQIVLPADSLARSPANASDVEATTLPMNGLTARLALDALGLRSGDTVAVIGAARAVGGYPQPHRADLLRCTAVVRACTPADNSCALQNKLPARWPVTVFTQPAPPG
ncbi:hypothetical protein [Nonomuraea insulae]|uniref:Uncharacterized protein n=1 Tax=Nonomuraea insulae TaxID=1616787 RepID=A0ABW1D9T1_9ACTN